MIHSCSYYCTKPECIEAQRNELRDKLTRPEQEPVAWIYEGGYSNLFGLDRTLHWYKPPSHGTPLYTAPQPRQWVDLTDEEISASSKGHMTRNGFARAVLSLSKEKNT